MSRAFAALLCLVSLGLAGCGSDGDSPGAKPAGGACLERPDQLPRPPGSTLPCELIPPGLSLK